MTILRQLSLPIKNPHLISKAKCLLLQNIVNQITFRNKRKTHKNLETVSKFSHRIIKTTKNSCSVRILTKGIYQNTCTSTPTQTSLKRKMNECVNNPYFPINMQDNNI